MKRPHTRDYETLHAYRLAFRDYAEYRHATGQHTPAHHEEDYRLVRRCPKCNGISTIQLLSDPEAPMWRCMTNPHHDYADGFFDREDFAEA